MKRLMLIVVLFALGGDAWCAPYFRPIDVSHIQAVGGALFDVLGDIKNTSATGLLPLITHSPKDGCLLPSIVCEDWTPLAIGASMNAGKVTFDVAPLANVLPWMSAGALAVIPDKFASLRDILTPAGGSVTFSAGPVWEYQQRVNRGFFKVFTGLALKF